MGELPHQRVDRFWNAVAEPRVAVVEDQKSPISGVLAQPGMQAISLRTVELWIGVEKGPR